MWARDFEIALGLWLALAPWIFAHGEAWLPAHDVACAAAIVLLGLLSYWTRTRRAHLLQLVVGAWLTGFGWLGALEEATPATQNRILVGLLLLMLAIVPSRASRPPRGWRGPADGQRPRT